MKKKVSRKGIKKSGKLNGVIFTVIVFLVIGVLVLNGLLFYEMIHTKANMFGQQQLDMVSGKLQIMLKDSEIILRQLANTAQEMLNEGAGHDEIGEKFLELKAQEPYSECRNIFIAGEDWYVVPDLVEPEEGFDPKERIWYQGARKKGIGNIYISSPYLDIVTGTMCYTVSVRLGDRDSVVGIDLDIGSLQESVGEIAGNGRDALIVSASGQIVGYPDETVVGAALASKLPQYTNVFRNIMSSGESSMSFSTKIAGVSSTVFYSCMADEWYLISIVSDYELYKDSYMQLIRNSVFNVVLIAVVLVMYLITYRANARAEKRFALYEKLFSDMSADLRGPIKTLMHYSEAVKGRSDEASVKLRGAAVSIDSTLSGVIAAASAASEESRSSRASKTGRSERKGYSDRRNKFVMLGVAGVMTLTLTADIFIYSFAVIENGDTRMQSEVSSYVNELNVWIAEQKSTVDMFARSISVRPELLGDYENAVKWLNDITKQYDDISVAYICDPEREHTVIMNNGWQPDEDFHVEQRQWYIDTMSSERDDGFSISAPYFDEQTGLYCVTFSERVYDMSGTFLGCFAVDFYIDKLTAILSSSYSDEGYAFLVDSNGQILNHPNKEFELSETNSVTVEQAGYLDVIYADRVIHINDFDGQRKAAVSSSEPMSRFNIICIRDNFVMYGDIAYYNVILVILFGVCIWSIIYILRRQMKWQKEANEMLRDAADAAERAGKQKSQFLAQMSHEIRTPINAVLGFNEMILRESDSRNIIDYSENIRNAGRTLLTLINGILDLSKIEDGKMEIVPVKYDTSSMINDLVSMIKDRAEKKELELVTEIDPDLPAAMYGDDVRLRQVITNLLTNAVKYTETGTVRFAMNVRSMDESSVTVHVEVEDTGIGIREDDIRDLFGAFRRFDTEKNRYVEGTGLGMPIVQRLLILMDSELQVSSVYGEGSLFRFDIVQGIADREGIGDYTKRLAESRKSGDSGMFVYAPDARVLIVDDNNMNLMVAKGLMKRTGMRIDTALSGEECIRLAEENNYDIIFLDHMMPGLDGIETYDMMKQRGLIPENTAVVMMTANAIVGAREEYLSKGFDDYLSKPIDVRQMERMLAKFIPQEKLSYKDDEGNIIAGSDGEALQIDEPEETKTSVLDRLKLIPGLDTDAGMRRCMNDEGFYLGMVRAYIDTNMLDELDAAVDPDDTAEYSAALYKLTSASLSIGASDIVHEAGRISVLLAEKDEVRIMESSRELLKMYRRLLGLLGSALR